MLIVCNQVCNQVAHIPVFPSFLFFLLQPPKWAKLKDITLSLVLKRSCSIYSVPQYVALSINLKLALNIICWQFAQYFVWIPIFWDILHFFFNTCWFHKVKLSQQLTYKSCYLDCHLVQCTVPDHCSSSWRWRKR